MMKIKKAENFSQVSTPNPYFQKIYIFVSKYLKQSLII